MMVSKESIILFLFLITGIYVNISLIEQNFDFTTWKTKPSVLQLIIAILICFALSIIFNP
jgi:hypothetical protein